MAELVFKGVALKKPLTTPRQGIGLLGELHNIGQAKAQPFFVDLIISPTPVSPAGTSPFFTSKPQGLLAGTSMWTDAILYGPKLPDGLLAGSWFLVVRADAKGQIPELDETNNTVVLPFTMPKLPDLKLTLLSGPATAAQGATITLAYTVENVGEAPAVKPTLEGWVSYLFHGGQGLVPVALPTLAPGASHSGTFTVALPKTAELGPWSAVVHVLPKEDDASLNDQHKVLKFTVK